MTEALWCKPGVSREMITARKTKWVSGWYKMLKKKYLNNIIIIEDFFAFIQKFIFIQIEYLEKAIFKKL